ncbi:MAG: replication restart helicase PriA, partial [Anaerolineae bacterium]
STADYDRKGDTPMYAQVQVFRPIRVKTSPFLDYHVPESLAPAVRPGVLVVVPVRTQILPGVVMGLTETPAVPETRDIQSVLDPEPAVTETLLRLARWMARETLAPLHKCIEVMLPPGMKPKAYLLLTPLVHQVPEDLPAPAASLLRLLVERGQLRSTQIQRALKGVDWRRARYYLKRRGLIEVERRLRLPRVRPRTIRMVRLVAPRSEWAAKLSGLRLTDLYRSILDFLAQEGEPVEASVVRAETGAETYHLRTLEERGAVAFHREEVIRDPVGETVFTPDKPPPLTSEQQEVWRELHSLLRSTAPPPALLLGVTGSGKTELYLRATAEVLQRGQQALILVPEISLTPQTVHRFAVRFPGQVGLWHSRMTEGERFDTWRRVRSGELSVLVGARSALFAPFPRLGLVVMDEEEDTSYKAMRQPYYHTRETAAQLAHMTGALFLMGSATPSLEAYHRARAGEYRLLKLPSRILGHRRRIADWQRFLDIKRTRYKALSGEAATIPLPPVQVVDMRDELKAGNRSIFSRALQRAVDRALAVNEQVILFLNRRGSATYVFCRDCGWVAECPNCEIPLTHHARANALICHRCGYHRGMEHLCPECGSRRVRAFGLGTEGLEDRVTERWSDARVLRWDRDVARSHGAHTAIMAAFARGEANVLVGTQMVARGLDLPKVTVVGVISADTALNLPDFRAAERTFQLLAQVAGRSGRGILGGRVFVQTYHPDHYAVQFAARHDYEGFAERELTFRRQAAYPPAMRFARLVYAHVSAGKAREAAEQLADRLQRCLTERGLPPTDVIGPAPAFFAKVRGRYRWHILLRSLAPAELLRSVKIPAGWVVDIDPVNIL